ncbi:MAG: cation diffusion facilitator family transporter [Fimbriimonadaceae bacterium]|nr:cation transporter [Chthonomonadaceae bacterium]MCO5296876.1 cation diffusion facilitator family transporter [Fimbriimonadaceae bacterium]
MSASREGNLNPREAARRPNPAHERAKRRASIVSLAFNLVFSVAKFAVAMATGSVSVLSEAVHSSTDVLAAGIAAYGVRASSVPPDEDHPYGHGKIEALGGFGESILLFLAVGYIVVEAIHRLRVPAPVENLDLALGLIALSTVGASLVGAYVLRVARRTESLALLGNGQHLLVDAVTSGGVLVGLALTRMTGASWADPAVALVLAVWMLGGAWKLARESTQQLIDQRLPLSELELIESIVVEEQAVLGHHRLRTRRSGDVRFVDMHIVVPREWELVRAHEAADRIERRIEEQLSPAHVVVHVDPYDPEKERRA